MKCPICGTWARVLETRGAKRRRECANLHRFNTVEKYAGRIPGLLQKWQRNAAIRADPRSSREVAKIWGISGARVREIRQDQMK